MSVLRLLALATCGFPCLGCTGKNRALAEDACALLFECEPEVAAEHYDSEEECVDRMSRRLRKNEDSGCGKAQTALVECAVSTFESECQPDLSVHCQVHALVCASPSTNDWACTSEEDEVYFDCIQ